MSAAKRNELRRENVERAQRYSLLSEAVMRRRAEGLLDDESLSASERVLAINPDFATLWNFRREVLQHQHPAGDNPESEEADRKDCCLLEFRLTQECLMANPKSYPVWSHRMWVVEWGRCSWQWKTELKLTAKMLALDDRNFHCWTYRRFIVRVASVPAVDELKYSTEKIMSNFSNYSAWHYRSKLLPQIHAADAAADGQPPPLAAVLIDELSFLRNAFFTAPDDQSAWFYHRWCLAQIKAMLDGNSGSDRDAKFEALLQDILIGELNMVKELLELEPEAKWPLLTAAFLQGELGLVTGERGEQLQTLKRVDPMRAHHYDLLLVN